MRLYSSGGSIGRTRRHGNHLIAAALTIFSSLIEGLTTVLMRGLTTDRVVARLCATSLAMLAFPLPILAQSPATATQDSPIELLRAEMLEVQRKSQQDIDNLRLKSERRIQELLLRIEELQALRAAPPGDDVPVEHVLAANSPNQSGNRLDMSGDFRLRFEDNSDLGDSSAYSRGVMRGRLAARFKIADEIKLGTRLVTGNRSDPRTADVTIGDFARDLDFSFDQLYAEYSHRNLMLVGGKFPKPFLSSELVWDGDVNAQGLGARYEMFNSDLVTTQFAGVYFAIDEETSPSKSDMLGGQLILALRPTTDSKLTFGIAYYDYDIPTIEPGLPGGTRGNNMATDGVTYVSDFNLLDGNAVLDYFGLGERWPLQLVANYVVNRGARVAEDSGFGVDIFAGHLSHKGAFKLRYGYSQAETDSVLGLFSNDNTSLATNYRLHTLSADYALVNNTFLGLTYYRFRQKVDMVSGNSPIDWASRLRLNLYFSF